MNSAFTLKPAEVNLFDMFRWLTEYRTLIIRFAMFVIEMTITFIPILHVLKKVRPHYRDKRHSYTTIMPVQLKSTGLIDEFMNSGKNIFNFLLLEVRISAK